MFFPVVFLLVKNQTVLQHCLGKWYILLAEIIHISVACFGLITGESEDANEVKLAL